MSASQSTEDLFKKLSELSDSVLAKAGELNQNMRDAIQGVPSQQNATGTLLVPKERADHARRFLEVTEQELPRLDRRMMNEEVRAVHKINVMTMEFLASVLGMQLSAEFVQFKTWLDSA